MNGNINLFIYYLWKKPNIRIFIYRGFVQDVVNELLFFHNPRITSQAALLDVSFLKFLKRILYNLNDGIKVIENCILKKQPSNIVLNYLIHNNIEVDALHWTWNKSIKNLGIIVFVIEKEKLFYITILASLTAEELYIISCISLTFIMKCMRGLWVKVERLQFNFIHNELEYSNVNTHYCKIMTHDNEWHNDKLWFIKCNKE